MHQTLCCPLNLVFGENPLGVVFELAQELVIARQYLSAADRPAPVLSLDHKSLAPGAQLDLGEVGHRVLLQFFQIVGVWFDGNLVN